MFALRCRTIRALSCSDPQMAALETPAGSRERGEADRAHAILLTLKGRTSARIAEVFCVREDAGIHIFRGHAPLHPLYELFFR